MPYLNSNGVQLYYEAAGRGLPIVFVHEFAGDLRSWEAQLRHFSRRYRCIAFNARGYPPSEVPVAFELRGHSPPAPMNVLVEPRLPWLALSDAKRRTAQGKRSSTNC